jgi:hypothetical protein
MNEVQRDIIAMVGPKCRACAERGLVLSMPAPRKEVVRRVTTGSGRSSRTPTRTRLRGTKNAQEHCSPRRSEMDFSFTETQSAVAVSRKIFTERLTPQSLKSA